MLRDVRGLSEPPRGALYEVALPKHRACAPPESPRHVLASVLLMPLLKAVDEALDVSIGQSPGCPGWCEPYSSHQRNP